MIIVDAHQDLAWNIATFGRDYTLSVNETRNKEKGSNTPKYNGDTLIGYPEYLAGEVAIVFSTLFAAPEKRKLSDWDTQCYKNFQQAQQLYKHQLDIYNKLVDRSPEKFSRIISQADLSSLLAHWSDVTKPSHPIGLVTLMEGAEAIDRPQELFEWWQAGVRMIGPAWAGTRFCGGTAEPGPLTKDGFLLLESMADIGFTLDISHMDEQAALQALDFYTGCIIASHANVNDLLPGNESNRFLSDRVIKGLLERNGVIGVIPYNVFLKVGLKRSDLKREVTLDSVISHIDYICQLAGNANHVGIGSDFDGGFGVQSTPVEIDTVADLQKIIPLLKLKGYQETDITKIMGGNWISYLESNLPEAA
jgi:membrane dipeptidase